jgi:hypothetical protein
MISSDDIAASKNEIWMEAQKEKPTLNFAPRLSVKQAFQMGAASGDSDDGSGGPHIA